MSSSKTRPSRQGSRFTSPANVLSKDGEKDSPDTSRLAANDAAARANGTKTFMERWLEPGVQNKTSFEEAGLMRYGVLETMAPLGALPKPKKSENGNVRKIILKTSGHSAANSASKEPSPATQKATATAAATAASATSQSTSPLPISPLQSDFEARKPRKSLPLSRPEIPVDDEDDEDFIPGGVKKGKGRRHSSKPAPPKKGRPPASVRRSSLIPSTVVPAFPKASSPVKARPTTPVKPRPVTPLEILAPMPASMPASAPAPAPEAASESASATAPAATAATHHDPDFVARVVELAVDEALHHFRYPTAYALRTLYDDNAHDSAFVAMIEDVFTQTADADTMRAFAEQMAQKKREGKKDNTGCYYFVPPATNSLPEPHKPLPAPYAKLVHRDAEDEHQIEPPRAAKKIKITHTAADKENSSQKMAVASSEWMAVNASDSRQDETTSQVKTPSRRRRARRDSASSDSSLSSAMSLSSPEVTHRPLVPKSPLFRGGRKAKAKAGATTSTSTSADTGTTGPNGTPKSRPITTRRKSLASKASQSNSNTPTIQSPTTTNPNITHILDDATMPGRITVSEPPVILTTKTIGKKGAQKPMLPPPDDSDYEEVYERRREAIKVTNNYTALESSIRDETEEPDTTPLPTRRTRQSLGAPLSTRTTRAANKRPGDNEAESPAALSFQGDHPPSSVVGSRPVTPTNLRPAKKQKTGLRIKLSPVKRKGAAAGVPRSMGDAQNSVTNGAAREQGSENDEFCSACGNAGDLVCCEGCPRSFHFECVDMDQSQAEDLPDEWFCNECLIRRYPSRVPVHTGSFAAALNNLEKRIPEAFSLPKRIQTRFEGVKAGKDGDYEEVIILARGQGRKAKGYEETPDYFKLREDGEAILCHDCQKPATDVRAIIPCSACSFHWHTDCLDPPLANPPLDSKSWKCPLHIDELLADAPPLAPAHRYRKLRHQQAIVPAISRGLRNNGHIEIDWSAEDAAREEREEDVSGWRDWNSFGRTYKIPAKGVILDFIEQLRQRGAGHGTHKALPNRTAYLTPPVEDRSSGRTVEEMQTSLILTSLRQAPAQPMEQLTTALLASADPAVISLIAKGNANSIAKNSLADSDKQSLQVLLSQIETMGSSIRDILTRKDAPPTAEKRPDDTMDIVTEPTPPSTIDHGEGAMDFD